MDGGGHVDAEVDSRHGSTIVKEPKSKLRITDLADSTLLFQIIAKLIF